VNPSTINAPRVRIVPSPGPNVDAGVVRNARATLTTMDLRVVVADDVRALRQACANPRVPVVKLRGGVEYLLRSDLAVRHGIVIQGVPGATIKPYSADYAPEIVVDAASSADVELRDLWTYCPVLAVTPIELRGARLLGDYGTAHASALVDIYGAAAGSGLIGCRSSAGFAGVGMQIDAAAGGSRVIGCDFASCATPYRLATAGGHHYGTLTGTVSDVNHGAVTLY